jgi:hypothetical protein
MRIESAFNNLKESVQAIGQSGGLQTNLETENSAMELTIRGFERRVLVQLSIVRA